MHVDIRLGAVYASAMVWYADGPGKLQYEHGDVIAAARASGVGRLLMVPRVAARDEDEEAFEELELLGPLQDAILERDLPWEEVAFDTEADRSGESMAVDAEADPRELLEEIADIVREHARSIRAVIRKVDPDFGKITEIDVSAEFTWTVPRKAWAALARWLEEPLGGARITEAELGKGKLDEHGWYQPPDSLSKAEKLLSGDAPRHLAFHGWAHAVLAGEKELQLFQPDDDYQEQIWSSDDDGLDDDDDDDLDLDEDDDADFDDEDLDDDDFDGDDLGDDDFDD